LGGHEVLSGLYILVETLHLQYPPKPSKRMY
jgi:hypothetical protein